MVNAKIKKAKSGFSALCSGRTCTEEFFHSKDLQKQIDGLIASNNYDVIYIFCSSMASYVRDKHNIPRVIDFVDIDSDKWIQYSKFAPFFLRWLYRREGKILGQEEENILSWAEAAFLVTELEAEFFSHLDQSSKVYGIPNGIDRSFFDPDKTPSDEQLANEKYVCFTGAMDYFPNEDGVLFFYEKIYPHIRKQLPDLKLYVVGSNPTPRLQKLAQDKNVVVTGTVDDIRSVHKICATCCCTASYGAGYPEQNSGGDCNGGGCGVYI